MLIYAYDSNHMKKVNESLNWPSLIATQPAAGLIPGTLREVAKRVDANAHETFFRIGDPVRHLYLVISGEARLVRIDRRGREVMLQRSRGGFIAEASLDSRSYHCDAIAAESTKMLMFTSSAFRQALEDDFAFRRSWQTLLAKEVRKLRAQCERLALNSAVERVIHYIESEGSDGVIELTQSRKSLAAELGITHEALYRTLRRAQDEGVLEVAENRLSTRV
jgi:CRP-like cAMP-binding protein